MHVTHNFDEAMIMADKVCVLNNGEIIENGSPDDIFKRTSSEFVAEFVDYKNIFKGNIIEAGDDKVFKLNNIEIFLVTDKTGRQTISISPEDIILTNEKIISSARNCFCGKVIDISFKQYICEVTVDIGAPLVAYITKKSCENLGIEVGKDIWTVFKAVEVHVF